MSRPKTKNCICKMCGKEFAVHPFRVGKAKYCSYACAIKARTSDKSYNKPRICIGCKKEFLPTHWHQKSCSRECFTTHAKRKTKIIKCLVCGKDFKQVRQYQKYCSRKCGKPYQHSTNKTPSKNVMDELWSELIKLIAEKKCEYCGKLEHLNSHHIFSRSNLQVRWDIDNGVCVCVGHHVFGNTSAHKSPIEFIEWLKEKRGNEWYERLREKSRKVGQIYDEDKIKIKQSLKEEAEKWKQELAKLNNAS